MTPQTSPVRNKRMEAEATNLVSDSPGFCFTREAGMQLECRRHSELFRKVIAEIIGSFFLVFCVCGVSMADSISHGGMDIMGHAIAAGFAIMVIIFSIGSISGAHVNPAVTIAFASIRQFPWSQVPFYVGAQLLGAILATLLAKALYNQQADVVLTQPGGSIYKAFFMEILISFEFMFLATAVTSHGRAIGQQAGIAIGVAIPLNILLAAPISGASMNPARSLGPAIVLNHYDNIWIYLLAPPFGATCGAVAYKILHIS